MRDFKVGDILICKKDSHGKQITTYIKKKKFIEWIPDLDMYKDTNYSVVEVDDYDIKVVMITKDCNKSEYFGYDEERANHWEKWFYTISELRDQKLNQLGII